MSRSVLSVAIAVVLLIGCGSGGKAGAGDYKLKVSVNPANGGSITIDPNMDSYNEWADVKVTATANKGYVFEGWSGDAAEKSNSVAIKMSGSKNKKLTANFKTIPTFKDSRDGKTYETVTIGGQTWMRKNLNFAAEGSKCYENNAGNCEKYGRLYDWSIAKTACPAGWHLPSKDEWTTLTNNVGRSAGTKLKSTEGWDGGGNGTDDYAFSALPGGGGRSFGGFGGADWSGNWWSATGFDALTAWLRYMGSSDNNVGEINLIRTDLYSVRCVAGDGAYAQSVVSTFKDSRDGKTYKTVKVGGKTWMAENQNFAADGSKCYENNAGNCEKYGRLYNWATALKACPAGFHLPSDDEWTALENAVGGRSTAGTKLKSAAGWNNNSNGTDDYGFSALPGGGGNSYGNFYNAGSYGFWWSATELDANYARRRLMSESGVGWDNDGKTFLSSVRCVAD